MDTAFDSLEAYLHFDIYTTTGKAYLIQVHIPEVCALGVVDQHTFKHTAATLSTAQTKLSKGSPAAAHSTAQHSTSQQGQLPGSSLPR
jgi:hypothetical protein